VSEKTMTQHLKAAAYVTGIVGKWHLGDTDASFTPPARSEGLISRSATSEIST